MYSCFDSLKVNNRQLDFGIFVVVHFTDYLCLGFVCIALRFGLDAVSDAAADALFSLFYYSFVWICAWNILQNKQSPMPHVYRMGGFKWMDNRDRKM